MTSDQSHPVDRYPLFGALLAVSDHRRDAGGRRSESRSARRYLEHHPPQFRDIGQCSLASYGRGGVARRAGCQSCDRSGWPSSAASSGCHRRLIPSQCYQPSDAPAGSIVGWIGEGGHEVCSGRRIESGSSGVIATRNPRRSSFALLSRIVRVAPSSSGQPSLDLEPCRPSNFVDAQIDQITRAKFAIYFQIEEGKVSRIWATSNRTRMTKRAWAKEVFSVRQAIPYSMVRGGFCKRDEKHDESSATRPPLRSMASKVL